MSAHTQFQCKPQFLICSHRLGRRDSLVSVLVLDSQPVVNSFLTNSFVIEPATERERETLLLPGISLKAASIYNIVYGAVNEHETEQIKLASLQQTSRSALLKLH